MSDKELESDLEPQLQLVEQEPKKNKLDDLAEQYNRLNAKCDIILEKIRNRKKKASNE